MMHSPPPYVPFVEYALKALEHPPYMYVAKLAACCTMLFLTRENPEMLQNLCHKWAIRFARDRLRLVGHVRKRASYCIDSSDPLLYHGGDATLAKEDIPSERYAQHVSEDHIQVRHATPSLCCCDPDKAVEHMLSILNTLVPMYFSWNWHRADYVIQINKEYEVYVREYVLPLCANLTPEEGIDDSEHTPWLLPPHTYLEPTESISPFYTPTSTGAPYRCEGSPSGSKSLVSIANGTTLNRHHCISASGSPTTRNTESEGLDLCSLQKQCALTPAVREKCSTGVDSSFPQQSSPSITNNGFDDSVPYSSLSNRPTTAQTVGSQNGVSNPPIMSPNVMCARAFSATAVYGLRFLTLSNYREALLSNTTGLVIVFHAKYSAKSNEAIQMFHKITEKRLLNPMPTIAVVYAVMEPELSSLYKVSWFPTIVYTPPLRYQKHHHHHDSSSGLHSSSDQTHQEKTCGACSESKRSAPAGNPPTSARTLAAPMAPTAVSEAPLCPAPTQPSRYRHRKPRVNGLSSNLRNGLPRRGRRHAPDSMSLPVHNSVEVPSRRTTGHTPNEAEETAPSAEAEEIALSSKNNSMCSRLTEPLQNHGAAVESNGSLATTSGHHPSTSTDSRPDSLSAFAGSPREKAKSLTPSPRETVSSAVGESVHAPLAPPLRRWNDGSPVSSSCHSGSIECRARLMDDYSGEAWRESFQDVLDANEYVIYPLEGVQTIPSLVEWISSRGASVPRLRKMRQFFTCIKSVPHDKFKRYREMHSAVVTLRRLQGIKDDLGVAGSGSRGGAHTPSQLTPPHSQQSQQPDQPLFIFLGGGMAAGKTTAVAALARSSWWENHKEQSVVVNADEFKLPLELEMGSPEAHIHSTRAAENLLVKAINQGRSVVFDGTMMWKPFVEQVVAMVRDAHHTLFKQGPGYDKQRGVEQYFLSDKTRHPALTTPYKIIFLGITVDVETAVPRGFLRKFQTNRGVPISMQLRSFKLFAENFHDYVSMVDETTLYNNNVFVKLEDGELPPVLAECNEKTEYKLAVHDEAAFQQFLRQQHLNEHADNVMEVFPATPVT
ncbi:hypothetical protein JKF63_01764 [Porcisia hertigi]|uniref:Zeta toxin domain-containing protein n=1 Tax=Porcisia hertigi TaxID=2761500 RepID=A0A836H5B9_9TRYP|nr:hypothetical protein JKF63_01764 [Porcisia hertigi]